MRLARPPKRCYRAQRYAVLVSWLPTRHGPYRARVSLHDGRHDAWLGAEMQVIHLMCEAQGIVQQALGEYLDRGGFAWHRGAGL